MSHKTPEELYKMLDDARKQLSVGSNYYHYKHPDQLYTLVDVVIIEADDTVGVLYRAEYESLKGIIFVRPIDDFLAEIEVDNEKIKRFTKVD